MNRLHHPSTANTLDWDDLDAVASTIFQVWPLGRDRDWARQAWIVMGSFGLTAYANEIQRCQVALRFLTVASYYYRFCNTCFQKHLRLDLLDWPILLEINAVRLGQLLSDRAGIGDRETDAIELFKAGILASIDRLGSEVISALENGFGSRKQLFISLWRSCLHAEYSDPESELYRSDEEIYRNARLPSGRMASQVFGC
jgi:hypothetical protein